MTFEDWIQNPSGKGSAVVTNRQMYHDMYMAKYNKIMLREGNTFTIKLFKERHETAYYAYIKVPSEVIKNFYYDVVIKFFTDNKGLQAGRSLKQYDIQVFTNSPDFVFTHCHAYVKAGLFLKEMSPRMSRVAIRTRATERNPRDEVGYVKSIYFAYLIMKYRNLFDKTHYAEVYDRNNLLRYVMDADTKTALRQEAEERLRKENAVKKREAKASLDEKRNTDHRVGGDHISQSTKIGKAKITKTSKKSGKILSSKKSK